MSHGALQPVYCRLGAFQWLLLCLKEQVARPSQGSHTCADEFPLSWEGGGVGGGARGFP